MAKLKKAFFCRSCGYESTKWVGKCPACGEWNTLVEEVVGKESSRTTSFAPARGSNRPVPVHEIERQAFTRTDLANGGPNGSVS